MSNTTETNTVDTTGAYTNTAITAAQVKLVSKLVGTLGIIVVALVGLGMGVGVIIGGFLYFQAELNDNDLALYMGRVDNKLEIGICGIDPVEHISIPKETVVSEILDTTHTYTNYTTLSA